MFLLEKSGFSEASGCPLRLGHSVIPLSRPNISEKSEEQLGLSLKSTGELFAKK